MKNYILSHLPEDILWQVHWFKTIDSTNNEAKRMARAGAPHGTVVVAAAQTQGRGRMERSFCSAPGGLYLSVILRPRCAPQALMHLTCAAGVAACNAVEAASGFRPQIKWTNDLIAHGKKLGGILTELSIQPGGDAVEYAVLGIGINCTQPQADFPASLQDIAVSLSTVTGQCHPPEKLAAAVIAALHKMDSSLLSEKSAWMRTFRQDCCTLGKQVRVLQAEHTREATALDVDDDGGLLVAFADGSRQYIRSGEVSIRGMCGYA